MKKFIFSLQAVLNVKRAQEKQKIAELTECNARIREFERMYEELLFQEREQNERYRKELEEGLTPLYMMFWRWAQMAVKEQINYRKRVLEDAEGERQRIETALIAAMKERKVLEKLREKEWEAYRVEQQRETAAELAEYMGHSVFTEQEGS
jgi:flagellar FliJ protein